MTWFKIDSAADVVKGVIKRPWLASCVLKVLKKLKKLFPSKTTPENEVSVPMPKTTSAELAASTILWKNLSVDTYKQLRRITTCSETGFSVLNIKFNFIRLLQITFFEKGTKIAAKIHTKKFEILETL